MTPEELAAVVEHLIDGPLVVFELKRSLFDTPEGRERFNALIRQRVLHRYGVYMLTDLHAQEVLYVGMAGKVKTNGTMGDHTIQKRLLASRGKDPVTRKDIQTNDWVRGFMNARLMGTLRFHILYAKQGEPPALMEALMLNAFYKQHGSLPALNNAF